MKNIINIENITDAINVSTDYTQPNGFEAPVLTLELPNARYTFNLNHEFHLKGLFFLLFIKDTESVERLKFKFLLFKEFINTRVYSQKEIDKHKLIDIVEYINSHEYNHNLFEEDWYNQIHDFYEIFGMYKLLINNEENKDFISGLSEVNNKPLLLFYYNSNEREFLDFSDFSDTGSVQTLSLLVLPEIRLHLLTRSLLDDKYKVIEDKTIIPLCKDVSAIYRDGGYQVKVNYKGSELDFLYSINFEQTDSSQNSVTTTEVVEYISKDNRELKLKISKYSQGKYANKSEYKLKIGESYITYDGIDGHIDLSDPGILYRTRFGDDVIINMISNPDGTISYISNYFLIYNLLLGTRKLKYDKDVNNFLIKTHSNKYLKLLSLKSELEKLIMGLEVRFISEDDNDDGWDFNIREITEYKHFCHNRYQTLFNNGAFNLNDILPIVQVFDELTDTDKLRNDIDLFIENKIKEKDLEKIKLRNRDRESLKNDIDLLWSGEWKKDT